MGAPVLPPMTSQRPYLLRALYAWISDNGMTPHLLVNAQVPGVRVPAHTIKDGQVVLNIADRAVAHLEMGNDSIRFSARFGGVNQQVVVPVWAVLAIYARETGQGMALPEEHFTELGADDASETEDASESAPATQETPQPASDAPKRGSHLRIVK
jgi:stringent starvation protein B